MEAEGWYHDPFECHRDRWFSAGRPTRLVRDDAGETYDPPPDVQLSVTSLVAAATEESAWGQDLLRVDRR
jgi:hypothetical protein